MSQSILNADHIPLMEDVWRFIKGYFKLPYDDVVKVSYNYKAGEFGQYHYMNIERVSAKEGIGIPYYESMEFVIALLKEFNLDWRTVTSLSFELDADSVPVFDMGVFPFIIR